MKKTNIKIKKSKINIYNKRKNKTKRTVSLLVTIVLACVLGVVGYGVGKPIIKYLSEREPGSNTSDPIDSTPSGGGSANSGTTSSDIPVSSSDDTSEPEPVEDDTRMYVLPITATASTEALNSALAVAKEAGYNCAAVTLKDDTGVLHYKSEIPRIKDWQIINTGTLSAQLICDTITKAGLTPAARISTIKDRTAPGLFGTFAFPDGGMWLDNAADLGGKPWLSPFEEVSGTYIQEITEELSAAGFKHIICVDTKFPALHVVDYEYLSHLPLADNEKRCEALWNVIDKAKAGAVKNGAKLWVEMSGRDLAAENKLALDTELANNKEKLKNVSIVVRYSAAADVTAVYSDAKAFSENIKSYVNGAELAVMTDETLKGAALADAEKAFDEAGLTVFAIS